MSNIIINPTSEADVIKLGEHVQRISKAKELWYAAVERYQMQGMNTTRSYQMAVRTLIVNGYQDVGSEVMNEIMVENTTA